MTGLYEAEHNSNQVDSKVYDGTFVCPSEYVDIYVYIAIRIHHVVQVWSSMYLELVSHAQ